MEKCKARFNKMLMTTFGNTVLLRSVRSSGVVSNAMKGQKGF